MVVVVILIISGMVAQLSRRALLNRRQAAEDLRERQTWELVNAGRLRAQRLRKLDKTWTGDIWKTTAGEDSQTNQAEVVVTTVGNSATVVARFPADGPAPVQITQHVELEDQ